MTTPSRAPICNPLSRKEVNKMTMVSLLARYLADADHPPIETRRVIMMPFGTITSLKRQLII